MKKYVSLPIVMLLALVASNSFALLNHFHEGEAHWYVMPKIGAAPSIFSSHRAHQMLVVPYAAVDEAACSTSTAACNVNNFANVLQETQCLPKFGDMFNQGVLHVGVEIGRNICDRSECFLEFTYDRASGSCHNPCSPFVTGNARVGCSPSADCSNSCSTSSCSSSCDNDCSPSVPTGFTSLSDISSWQDNFDNYQAYGGFIGCRHFTNRFWCDTMSFWYGFKVGVLHRNRVDACTTIVYNTAELGTSICAIDTFEQNITRAVFCKSNTVSGGLQIGFDYCYSDRLAFQLGFEVVAAAGLRGNQNHTNDISALNCSGSTTPFTNELRVPSNIIISDTGAVLNFPIWFGLTWEFGSCLPACMKRCN